MEYKDLIEELKNGNKKVLVVGPQRTGTRFTTNVIAKDLNVKLIDELDYNIDKISQFLNMTKNLKQFVAQAPALTHLLDKIPEDITIVYMFRDITDIVKSQKRINWSSEKAVIDYTKKEFNNNKNINWGSTISEIKYEIWENIQKPSIKNKFYELEYESLKTHSMWKDKSDRSNFKANQIR